MLCEVPLNKEQQAFAADHHGLVYKFLNENRLPEDEFYDVIIFGYLRAVYRYFNEPKESIKHSNRQNQCNHINQVISGCSADIAKCQFSVHHSCPLPSW